MQRNPHSYQIATGYRTFYSLSLIYQPITKKRLFFRKKCVISFGCFKKYAHICTGIYSRYLQSNRLIFSKLHFELNIG